MPARLPAEPTMSATVLDGQAIARQIKRDVQGALNTTLSRPALAILSFQNPSSETYLRAQEEQAQSLGIGIVKALLPENADQDDVKQFITQWNERASIHGIFVHQPMPNGVDPQYVSAIIDPRKDVEGIHPQNMARRFFARGRIGSCTALAVMRLIEETDVNLEGKEAVVVGHSEIVGRPVSMLLLDKLATTTVCHIGTDRAGRLEEHVRRADVLVVAVGRPKFIKGSWIKPGAVVIDVGINVTGGKVEGDVEFDEARKRAAFISPVPGGVGPVTVMMVMKNAVEAFKLQQPTQA